MNTGFVRWVLRALDVARARAFYEDLLEEGAPLVVPLPENQRARGARPHWLGYLATDDVEAATGAWVLRGAARLGTGELIRDPGGAILALVSAQIPSRRDVIWHQLLTPDPAQAKKDYSELFGMTEGPQVELPVHGTFHQFSWGTGELCGSIGTIRGKPHIHAQWLFFFRVSNLNQALTQVRSRQGSIAEVTVLSDGAQAAVCEDAQGAAFALMCPSP